MERCTRCGEPLAEADRWCSLCLRRRVDRAELAEDLRALVGRTTWVPENRFFEKPRAKRYSRVDGGPLSFGVLPKIALSLGVAIASLCVSVFISWHTLYRNVTGIFVVLGAGLLLRAIWRKERIG